MKSLQGGHGVRNKFTKQACITLAIGVMIASAVGCSTKSNSEQNVPAQNEQTQNRQPENMGSKTQQPREEATISLGRVVGGDTKFKNGETIEDNVHTRWAKKKFNINFKVDWTVGTGDAFTSKLRLLLNSGEKLPDVFTLNDPALEKQMVDSGKVMDITEAFDKYASPRIKEL
jgi:putative aldouronate transport system substrate-binding protein